MLFLDGAYTFSGNRPTFHRAHRPAGEELNELVDTLSRRIVRALGCCGLLIVDPEHPHLELEPGSSLGHLHAASILYRFTIGDHAGYNVPKRRLKDFWDHAKGKSQELSWDTPRPSGMVPATYACMHGGTMSFTVTGQPVLLGAGARHDAVEKPRDRFKNIAVLVQVENRFKGHAEAY